MGERSGLGLVEVTVLEALDAAGATPDHRHRSSARVLGGGTPRRGCRRPGRSRWLPSAASSRRCRPG